MNVLIFDRQKEPYAAKLRNYFFNFVTSFIKNTINNMKKIIYAIAALSLVFAACQSKTVSEETQIVDTIHHSQNSLDWAGTYAGTIPCADCEGINVRIILNSDETFELSYQYLGKSEMPYIVSGKFTWSNDGGMIILDNGSVPSRYKVGENMLIQLDMDGNEITGDLANMYILTKVV